MKFKIIFAALFFVNASTELLSAEEPLKAEPLILTRLQVNAAQEIAKAIRKNSCRRIEPIYNKFFAKDLAPSPDRNIKDQRILAQVLVNYIRTMLTTSGAKALNPLKNKAGKQFLGKIPSHLLMLAQPALEQLGPMNIHGVTDLLSLSDIARCMQTCKEAEQFLAPILAERAQTLYSSSQTFKLLRAHGHTAQVNNVVFSHNGKIVASGSDDNTIILWNTATGQMIKKLTGHTGPITSLDFSPHDIFLVSADTDGTIISWKVETGDRLKLLQGKPHSYNQALFSHNGKFLAYTTETHGLAELFAKDIIRILELKTGHERIIPTLKPIKFSFAKNDQIIAIWDDSIHGIYLISLNNPTDFGSVLQAFKIPRNYVINALLHHNIAGPYVSAFSPNLKYCAACAKDVLIIKKLTHDEKNQGVFSTSMYNAIAFSPNSYLLAAVGDNFLSIHTIMGSIVMQLELDNMKGVAVSFSPDCKTIAIGLDNGDIALVRPG